MSKAVPRRSAGSKFSLRHLLTITALIAVGIAVVSAYRKNRSLTQQLDELLSLSSRLQIDNEDELASVAMPEVAADFHSWHVHIPAGQDYELRLGIGAVSEKGIPPVVGCARLAAGKHRVTLHTGHSPREEFRYVVYVDGMQVIENTMGIDWLPGGWSSASSISWPRNVKLSPAPLQLSAQSYKPKLDYGMQHYFNGQSDEYVTLQGYRLWIDPPDRAYQPASPFMGFPGEPPYQGVGLRDGLRYAISSPLPYQWKFTRPNLGTIDPVLRMEAEFFASDGTVLSSQSQSFLSWQICDAAIGTGKLQWQEEPSQTTHIAFLHATSKSEDGLLPVVEMKWDTGRPDEVGLRLADTSANNQISRWRLHILGGGHHLWRKLQIGERPWILPSDAVKADEILDRSSAKTATTTAILDLGEYASASLNLRWQTNETLPLQIVERSQNSHAGLGLYKGLPVSMGIQIPAAFKPILAVDVIDQHPNAAGTAFPGGPVFDAIQIDLEAAKHDWIWLSNQVKE